MVFNNYTFSDDNNKIIILDRQYSRDTTELQKHIKYNLKEYDNWIRYYKFNINNEKTLKCIYNFKRIRYTHKKWNELIDFKKLNKEINI